MRSCQLWLAENDVACSLQDLEKQRQEPARALMARYVLVR